MSTVELEAMRAEIACEILNEEDETVLEKVTACIRKAKKAVVHRQDIIPGLPRTDAEKWASIREAEEDIRAGRVHTMEGVFKLYEKWL
jgi:polyribonucleotide nucleotidyltransferase